VNALLGFLKNNGQKEELREMLLSDLVRPSYIKTETDCIKVNDFLNRVIVAVGFPRFIREGWLDSIISSEGNFDVSLFVEPADISLVLTQLNHELVKQKSDMVAAERNGAVNPSLKVQYEDTYRVLEKLQSGEEKLFNMSLYVNAKARNKEELGLLSKKIESELNSMMVIPKTPSLRQQQAFQSMLPLGKDKIRAQRNIPSSALSACFPFTSSFLNLKKDGVMFGVNSNNNIPIVLNQYDFPNYNGLVLGSSGSGKSFFVKLFILRNLLNDLKAYVIDPQGEYSELVGEYGGQIIEISRNSDTIINPLDLLGREFGDKILSLMDLFNVMFGEITEVQRSALDRALIETYSKKNIFADKPATWTRKPPVLRDLYDELQKMKKKTHSKHEQMTLDALLNRLRIYALGSFSFVSRQTSLDLAKDLISFNIKDMPAQVKPVMMFLVLDYLYEKTQKDRERKLIVVDEAWTLLRYGEHAEYLFKICKTARKFGTGLIIVTQEVDDLLNSKAGNTILANTSWKLLLRQEPAVMQSLGEKFHLKEEERNFILTAEQGQGILFALNDRIPLKVVCAKHEYSIISTNPEELKLVDRKNARKKKESDLDVLVYGLKKSVFLKKGLSKDQIVFLKEHGFVEVRCPTLARGRGFDFLAEKPAGNESMHHFILVNLIYGEVKKYADKVVKSLTVQPDVMFFHKGKKYSFEVETGSKLKDKKALLKKIRLLNQLAGNWFFVVTNSKLKKEYSQYGATLTRTEVPKVIEKIFK